VGAVILPIPTVVISVIIVPSLRRSKLPFAKAQQIIEGRGARAEFYCPVLIHNIPFSTQRRISAYYGERQGEKEQ
jgi:hypothetical protein